jgi:hypothetical protein
MQIKAMKRSFLLLGLSLLAAFSLQAQVKDPYQSFQSGEWLRYRLHYGFLNASYATLAIKDTIYDGVEAYHAVGEGRTTGFASLFFKVEDVYQSIFSVKPIRPIHFRRDIDEGGYTKDISIDFNFDAETALITNNKTASSFVIPFTDRFKTFYRLPMPSEKILTRKRWRSVMRWPSICFLMMTESTISSCCI